jgi:hypothetical protein
MEKKFGLRFEIYNRAFVGPTPPGARLRRERLDHLPALHHLVPDAYAAPSTATSCSPTSASQARRSLLVVDEAHNAAPASAAKYAVDSSTTEVVRDVAQVFEHRLFLSATPAQRSLQLFSALLEILDPQRFTRGVPSIRRIARCSTRSWFVGSSATSRPSS